MYADNLDKIEDVVDIADNGVFYVAYEEVSVFLLQCGAVWHGMALYGTVPYGSPIEAGLGFLRGIPIQGGSKSLGARVIGELHSFPGVISRLPIKITRSCCSGTPPPALWRGGNMGPVLSICYITVSKTKHFTSRGRGREKCLT